jgi:hypothetical protein
MRRRSYTPGANAALASFKGSLRLTVVFFERKLLPFIICIAFLNLSTFSLVQMESFAARTGAQAFSVIAAYLALMLLVFFSLAQTTLMSTKPLLLLTQHIFSPRALATVVPEKSVVKNSTVLVGKAAAAAASTAAQRGAVNHYYLLQCIRKFIFALLLVFANDTQLALLIITFFMSVGLAVYALAKRPYQDQVFVARDVFCEILFALILIGAAVSTDGQGSKLQIAYLMTVCTLLILTVQVLVMLFQLYRITEVI